MLNQIILGLGHQIIFWKNHITSCDLIQKSNVGREQLFPSVSRASPKAPSPLLA